MVWVFFIHRDQKDPQQVLGAASCRSHLRIISNMKEAEFN